MAERIRIDEVGWSTRTAHVLKNEKIRYLDEIAEKTEQELLRIPNFGRKSLNELKEVLLSHGLNLDGAKTPTEEMQDKILTQLTNIVRARVARETSAHHKAVLAQTRKDADQLIKRVDELTIERNRLVKRYAALDRLNEQMQIYQIRLDELQKLSDGNRKFAIETAHKLHRETAEARRKGWYEGFKTARDLCLLAVSDRFDASEADALRTLIWPPVPFNPDAPWEESFGGDHKILKQNGENYNKQQVQVVFEHGGDTPEVVVTNASPP